MKQYMLATHYIAGEPDLSESAMQQVYAQVDALNQELQAADIMVFGGGLLPPDSSTVVRNVDGAVTVTDGPFAEAKEQLGGFWVLKCADLDVALEWAKKASAACMGAIEVRPFGDEAPG
jgi:hypothetical protein